MTLHFPPTIDSTILAAFRSCPQKAFRSYFEHWKPASESVHLVAGGAFAKGLEIARRAFYEQGATTEEAEAAGLTALIKEYGDFECPPDSAKSLERTAGALEFYFDQYPLDRDGAVPIHWNNQRGIEFSFAEPLDIRHPETGDPLLYTGRSDMIVDFAGGVYIEDDKTTSSLGASWAKQWEHRSQFTGYTWAAKKVGIEASGVLVRGVSILKTKYDTAQVLTSRADWEVDRWYEQTCRDVQRMIQMWSLYNHIESTQGSLGTENTPPHTAFDYNLDHACAEYGGCGFTTICKAQNPEEWLPMYFVKRVWDPLARKEMTTEEWEKKWFSGVAK
jgi:hypothetical protein